MPQDMTDINQQPMPGGNTNAPASGTYGEATALSNLQGQLPTAPPGGGGPGLPPVNETPIRSTRGTTSNATQVPGVPDALMHPTMQPDVPVGTPLAPGATNPVSSATTSAQRNLAILDSLETSPNVSPETREWAGLLKRRLIAQTKQ